MNPQKNNEKDEEDPFKRMIEEMMKSVDKMMKEDMDIPEGRENPQNQATDITFNFSFNPAQRTPVNPQQRRKRQKRRNAEIIERENEMIAVIEIQNLQKEDLKTKLKTPRKLQIKTPKAMKEIPLPTEAKEIKKQTYKNGVLEIKINKDQNEDM